MESLTIYHIFNIIVSYIYIDALLIDNTTYNIIYFEGLRLLINTLIFFIPMFIVNINTPHYATEDYENYKVTLQRIDHKLSNLQFIISDIYYRLCDEDDEEDSSDIQNGSESESGSEYGTEETQPIQSSVQLNDNDVNEENTENTETNPSNDVKDVKDDEKYPFETTVCDDVDIVDDTDTETK